MLDVMAVNVHMVYNCPSRAIIKEVLISLGWAGLLGGENLAVAIGYIRQWP